MPNHEREQEWAALMTAALAGDAGAYKRLLDLLAPAIRIMARGASRRFASGSSDVEDVVQEALLAIHLKRHTWNRNDPISPWIYAIVRNKFIDTIRRRSRRAETDIGDRLDDLPSDDSTEFAAAYDISRLLDQLPEREQDIVRSISIRGDSVREVADRLKMNEVAVRVALHRALKNLAAFLRKDEP